jgi:hypothetical protein
MRYIAIILMLGIAGCSGTEFRPGESSSTLAPDEYIYFEKELAPNIYVIEVLGDSWYASSESLKSQVESGWKKKANELCPEGIEKQEFKTLHPGRAYFEEIRCRKPSCMDGIVGHGVVTCNKKKQGEVKE